ncbi:MAG: hypothetical protein NVS9B15_17350 [Acidobacteriaceae bacterium]
MAATPILRTSVDSERLELLERLNQAARLMNSVLDVDRLLDIVVNEVAGSFGLCNAIVLLRDPLSDELVTAAVRGTPHAKGSRYRIGRDGMVGHTAAQRRAYYARDVRENPHYLCCSLEVKSELDIPILSNNELLGVLSLECDQVGAFTDDEVEVLTKLADHIAAAIHNSRLYQAEHGAHHRLAQAEEEARLVQRSLFPKLPPSLVGFDFDGQCLFAGRTGGDWFDYIPLSPTRYGVVLADVSGKGMAAALLMTTTRTLLRLLAKQYEQPALVLSELNKALLQEFPDARYVTMIYGVVDAEARTFTFANAGHPAPLFKNGGASSFLPVSEGLPLALLQSGYDERVVPMQSGSAVVLYSDGVTEAYGRDQVEFGMHGLQQHADREPLSSTNVLRAVERYSDPNALQDDATVVVIRAN